MDESKTVVAQTRLNPLNKGSVALHKEARGYERPPMLSVEMSKLVPDPLHLNLNMCTFYENSIEKPLAYSHTGDMTKDCPELYETRVNDSRLEEAKVRYKIHVKSILQFSRSITEKRQVHHTTNTTYYTYNTTASHHI